MDLYLIDYKYFGFKSVAVTQDQLLPMLANKKWQKMLEKSNWKQNDFNEIRKYHLPKEAINYCTYLQIIKYSNVQNPYWQVSNFGRELKATTSKTEILSDCHTIKLILVAQKWLKEKAQTEKWSGQMEYLSVSNKLGKTAKLPAIYIKTPIKNIQRHVPHNASGYQHPRAGYVKSAFARSNYIIAKHYDVPKNIPLRHFNRNFRRKHLENFPWWDDNEYIRSKHSTGWKYSTKYRKQWLK